MLPAEDATFAVAALSALPSPEQLPSIDPDTGSPEHRGPPCLSRALPLGQAVQHALLAVAARADELGRCGQQDVADHIHALRRVMRQAQALVRLIAPGLVGDKTAKQPLQRIAVTARTLSKARDAEVLPEAWAALPLPVQHATSAIALFLQQERLILYADAKTLADLQKAAHSAAAINRKFAAALPPQLPANLVGEGLRTALGRVATAHKQARKRPRPEAVHDLRKACKDVRHQLEWLGADAALSLHQALVDYLKALGGVTDLFALDRWLRQAGRACPPDERATLRLALDKLVSKSTGKQIARCGGWMDGKPKKLAKRLVADLGW